MCAEQSRASVLGFLALLSPLRYVRKFNAKVVIFTVMRD